MPPRPRANPDTGEISQNEVANRLGLTKQAVGLWTAKPGAPVRREGARVYVRWPDFARWREQMLTAEARKPTTGSFVERRQEAEARSAEIRAELDALALAEKQGEVVALEDYEAALATILDRLTARLRAIPLRLAHLGTQVEAALEQEVEDVVAELNAWNDDVVDETEAVLETGDPPGPAA